MKSAYQLAIAVLLVAALIPIAHALSDEAIFAKSNITSAENCINSLVKSNISITRANSSLQDAIQLYNAQMALEEKKKEADYTLVISFATDVCRIKESAVKASDELEVFLETYNEASQTNNLSKMDEEYSEILKSFKDERFEDTLAFVEEGYKTISEIQAEQTAVKLFYEATSRSIKNFLKTNWKRILIILAIVLILGFIFEKTIKRAYFSAKINHLEIQKKTLLSLIRDMQKGYFSTGKVSETEYTTKVARYKQMMLDIDRQIPLLKEEMFKLKSKNAKYKESSEVRVREVPPQEMQKGVKPKTSKVLKTHKHLKVKSRRKR